MVAKGLKIGILAIAIVVTVVTFGALTGWYGLTRRTLIIKGSTTVLPIGQAAAAAYMGIYWDIDVQVSGGGSSVGVSSASDGTSDIGMASRNIKDTEYDVNPWLLEIPIAWDGLAIIIHPDNAVTGLTIAQVQQIYAGYITNWASVGGASGTIVLVGRDSASGTRETFEKKVMGDEENDPGMLELNSNGAVKEKVASTPAAIGYVGIGYIDSTVVALEMEGVTPSSGSVLNQTYPISRQLYFITDRLPSADAAAFIKFLLASPSLIEGAGFIPLTAYTGTITIKGSTTVLPIMEAAAEMYMMLNPDVSITVSGGGSSVGVSYAAGLTDGDNTAFGMSSRTLKSSEEGQGLVMNAVCKDGIAIIVNPSNTITELTTSQVQSIYKGDITNWNQVGGADQEIVLVGRDSASGTRETFEKKVMGDAENADSMLELNSNGAVKEKVVTTAGAIGYVGMGYVSSDVVALSIDGITANQYTVRDGSYPIARDLYLVTKGTPAAAAEGELGAAEFIAWMDSDMGRMVIKSEGFVTLT